MTPPPQRKGGEDAIVGWLRSRLGGPASLIGDDAALLPLPGEWALTVDSQIAGTHFPPGLDPAVVARRLLAVNLSDLAAVGAEPAYGLLALAAPVGFDHRRFLRAFTTASRHAGVVIAGGDLARAPLLVATLTLLGKRRAGGSWLRRDSGRPGDRLWVGGALGEAALGQRLLAAGAAWTGGRVTLPATLAGGGATGATARRAVRRHLLPRPQLALSAELAQEARCTCLDVSDGLARDLWRLADASDVGATVDAAALPLPRGIGRLAAALGEDPLRLALGGGEDYVLLFALPPEQAGPAGCFPVGRLEPRRGVRLAGRGGIVELPRLGWDHLAG